MSTPHPDQEALAELAGSADAADSAKAADSAATAEIRAHVADCAQCTADLAALRELRATLLALPPIPMPADVVARLEAALAAASASASAPAAGGTADVVPFARPAREKLRRTPRTREFPLGAAAAVVLVLAIGAVAIGLSNKGESKRSPTTAAAASSSAAASTASTTVIESGTNYTAADIRSQVIGVVNGAAPDAANQFPALRAPVEGGSSAAAAPAPAAAAATSAAAPAASFAPAASANGSAPALGLPARTAPSGPLSDPAALARCIQTLVQKAEQPVLVDYATFNGVPSTIIVLADPDVAGKLDVYVEADTANCASQVTFVIFLPPPASPAR